MDIKDTLSSYLKANRLAAIEKLRNLIPEDLLQTLNNLENVQLTLTDYKNKERYLERIGLLLVEPSFSTESYVIHYLLGSLYINFEKFWGPTIRIIIGVLEKSKHRKLHISDLIQHLKQTNNYIYHGIADKPLDERPDPILHRNFVFQILSKYPKQVESHDKAFMEEFFLFVEREVLMSPFIEKLSKQDLTTNDGFKKDHSSNITKSKETLITAFRIIQSFEQISSMHSSSRLKDLVLELLCCRDASVQKAAFYCLTAYNIEQLKPYSEMILRLLDEKKVKGALSMFSIDSESDQIHKEHRDYLVPIVHRVLFGRMVGRVGKKTSGHNKADQRKAIVMRYISGCTDQEILDFFKILFEPFYNLIVHKYEDLEDALKTICDVKRFVPLNKIQAILATLNSYLELVANLRRDTLPHLFKLINIISYYVVHPLNDEDLLKQMSAKCIDTLRALRKTCINISTDFFKTFQYYEFSNIELDFMFNTIIWPSCHGFVDKNHATITPVLRLIDSFTQNESFYPLLIKRNSVNQDEYLLHHIMTLYGDNKIERNVSKFIANMLTNLLDLKRDEDDMDTDLCQSEFSVTPALEQLLPSYDLTLYKTTDNLSFRHKMIMSYIPIIFERLRKNCEIYLEKKDSTYQLENSELLILSSLSEFIKDSEQCVLATRLLLSTLDNQRRSEVIIETLRTAQILMKQVTEFNDSSIVNYVANILSYQRNEEQRQELCNFITTLSHLDKNLELVGRAIELMNAKNEDFVELPNLVKWNEGFQIVFKYLDDLSELDVNQPSVVRNPLTILIHQVSFIISTIDKYEFSIRENCTIFYEKLSLKLKSINIKENGAYASEIIDNTILDKFIKKGLRDTNETVKFLYIGILRILALNCNQTSRTLAEFFLFCDKNPDLDFWLNVKHIQMHNRSKALARIVASDKIGQVSSRTLSAYFMPIASGFLFNKNYKSIISLSDNSIKLIGLICRQLNWNTYESTLSYYLDLLMKANTTYQRTNIKLITEIIKNFNYDITSCDEAMIYDKENRQLEERMKRRCGASVQQEKHLNTGQPTITANKRLNPSAAKTIYYAVTKRIIPRLNSCFHEMTRVDYEYDKNMSDYKPEKDEIKRIPMAYAIVQLLNLLPGRFVLLRDHLPALFLKLTTFLRSKNEETRKAARATLLRIMVFVGPAYVPDMLRVLKQNLDKGFYVHVLNYTIHSVLDKMDLRYGDLDNSAHELVVLCKQEIFGKPSEDKDVAKILAKTSEAKKTKSYETLLIIASCITDEKIDCLIGPFKELIKVSNEPRTVNKLSVCIQKIFTGLSQNHDFKLDAIFKFVQNSIEESIPNLKVLQKVDVAGDCTKSIHTLRPDRYLIKKDLTKERIKSRINEKGNLHMIVENSLRLLLLIFEKNKVIIKKEEQLQRELDGLIGLLTTCLKSSSPRCVTRSLKCIYFIAKTKVDLPSFKTRCNSIVKKIFILLSMYNGVGMAEGDNYDMIAMCFKTLSLLLLKCEHAELDNKQIVAFLSYIEQDLNDASRQATAFRALESVLHKKCESPELASIMNKVADLLVTSSDDNIRSMSTRLWQTYLLEYSHEPTVLKTHLTKFMRQLNYEYIDGRKSVLAMLKVIVEKFPDSILRNYFELFFNLLAQRLVNDDSKELRVNVGKLIALLLERLPDRQDYLFKKFVLPWANGDQSSLRILGAKLISVFIESKADIFDKKKKKKKEYMSRVLAIINKSLECKSSTDKATTNGKNNEQSSDIETDENSSPSDAKDLEVARIADVNDKLIYHSLRLFKRLLDKKLIDCIELYYITQLKAIWQDIANHKLVHWYEPIVLTSCELYLIFISKTPLGQSLKVKNPSVDNYLDWNATRIVRILCDRFIELLDKYNETSMIFKYIVQNLILLGQLIAHSLATLDFERKYKESFEGNIIECMLIMEDLPNDGVVKEKLPCTLSESKKRADLMWLSIKIMMQARKEAALYRLSQGYRRDLVLRWSAAIAQELGSARIDAYVFLLMMTPVRELTDKTKSKLVETSLPQNLIGMSEDLMKFLKSLLGVDNFNKIYSKVQIHYTKRRVERKRTEALLRVKDQTRGVKRKISDSKRKQQAKKKKMANTKKLRKSAQL